MLTPLQVPELEEHCQGTLSFKTKWITILHEEETYDQLANMKLSLFNLITVYECLSDQKIVIHTLVRTGNTFTMKHVNFNNTRDLYPNQYCGLCGRTIRISTMPVSDFQ